MKQNLLLGIFVSLTILGCQKIDTSKSKPSAPVIDAILSRRSIRAYTKKQVSREEIDLIMKCAVYAPSALNKQSWEVRIIQDPIWLDKLNQRFVAYSRGKKLSGNAALAQTPGFSVFHGAPTLIIIAADTTDNYGVFDCGMLTENILLAAQGLSIGTCSIGSVVPILNDPKNKDLTDRLKLSGPYSVVLAVSLGYPAEKPAVKSRILQKVQYVD